MCFSGVTKNDALDRVAEFETFNPGTSLRITATSMSGENELRRGESGALRRVVENVANKRDIVMHLGRQIDCSEAFKKCCAIIASCKSSKRPDDDAMANAVERIAEIFRDEYRFQWNLPSISFILAHCSNMCVMGDSDILQHFPNACDIAGNELDSTVLSVARQVYREYQMVLWPTSDYATPEQSLDSFHRLGQCGVLALDTYNAFIRQDGKQAGMRQ